ncbi:MAG: calcium-binding protein [Micavibrio sp.]
MNFILYDPGRLTYTINPGAATTDIQSLLGSAAKGTTFYFSEGTHTLTDTLQIKTDGITFTGAGRDKTTLRFDYEGTPGHGIHVGNSGYYQDWEGTVTKTVKKGAYTIELQDASALKAGDLILVRQKNSRQWLDDNGYENVPDTYIYKTPINESLVEVKSVSGNTVTLKQPITHDMNARDTTNMTTTVRLIDAVYDIKLSDFSIKFALGESNPASMMNTQPDYKGTTALFLEQTVDAKITNISIDEAPSHSLEFHTSLRPNVDHFSADGAHNKGSTGDGYGLHISETHYGVFKNLELTDVRHALVFSAWHTEVGNQVHILSANRDINYHGGPDYDNVVVVERAIYSSGSYVWPLVSPGDYHHPATDIDANTTVFGVAQATGLADRFRGWDKGAWLDGASGDDVIYGGAGNDVLIGGKGVDNIHLGGGSDIVAFRPGTGRDDIFGFGSGDKILLDGFSGTSAFSHISLGNVTGGALLKINGDSIALLHSVNASALSAANFIFNDGFYFTPPFPGGNTPPPPPPPPTTGIIVNAKTGTDNITGTSGDDTVLGWMSQINTTDRIALGAGVDTLVIRNGSVTLDSTDYPLFSGIDILDITAAGTNNLMIGGAFVDKSDQNILTIRYNRGLDLLDTSTVHSNHSVLLAGNGTVNLSDGNDAVTIANGTTGRVYGKAGNDVLYGSDGADFLFGGAGKDMLGGGKGSDQISGGGGADIFYYSDILDGGDTITDYATGDIVDLGILFLNNGLGGKSISSAQSSGHLVMKQNGADMTIAFDADGAAGTRYGSTTLATLKNTLIDEVNLTANPDLV